jgi:TolB protein
MTRRQFISSSVAGATVATFSGCWSPHPEPPTTKRGGRLFFTSQGRTALINADGSGLRNFEFNVPDQVTWQPGPFLADGRRVIFLSMEARRDGPGRPFDAYYHQTPTHLWLYDLGPGLEHESDV